MSPGTNEFPPTDAGVEFGAHDLTAYRSPQRRVRRSGPLFERSAPNGLGAEGQSTEPESDCIE